MITVTFHFGANGSCTVESWGDTPKRAKQAAQWADKRHREIINRAIREPKDEKVK